MLPRIQRIYEAARENGIRQPVSTFDFDKHEAAAKQYAALERWEKIARATARAIALQPVYIRPDDRIVGRVYHLNRKPVDHPDPAFDDVLEPHRRICEEMPDYDEWVRYQLCGKSSRGHVTWMWDKMLAMGTSGMRALYEGELQRGCDAQASQFYRGVLIMLDALDEWNARHVRALEALGMREMAALCARVPAQPAGSFHEAVQAFWMQHLVVMRENPYGGNGPGRLDYYLWPYLERDLERGAITLDQARELIDELFIRIDERIHLADTWVEAIVVGGSHRNGASAVNPLSSLMIESIMDLNLTHPSVYARLPKDAPEDFVNLCAAYVKRGENRAQLLSDEQIMRALRDHGVTPGDAAEYTCGGCMEIGIQGMTSDFLYNGWFNVPKILELCVSGGVCLKTGGTVRAFSGKSLADFDDFESFYQYFLGQVAGMLQAFFRAQDHYSRAAQEARPSYLLSSMIDDCSLRGRNMHAGGAKYHDYGSTPMGLPNAADALFAIGQAVFERKLCDADTLMRALRANFKGFEALQAALRGLPKYGQENPEADAMAARLVFDISALYHKDRNRWGGRGKVVILTFVWAPEAGAMLGATADGNLAGKAVAQGVTPQSTSMFKGITAAMNSCTALPFSAFNGGASTMWDLNPDWAGEAVIRALFSTFFKQGGQIFQGNMTDVAQLLDAQKNPQAYESLIVRVGGYSARFVNLSKALQEEIIARMRHAG